MLVASSRLLFSLTLYFHYGGLVLFYFLLLWRNNVYVWIRPCHLGGMLSSYSVLLTDYTNLPSVTIKMYGYIYIAISIHWRTNCSYAWRVGQAELAWMHGSVLSHTI